MKNKCVFVLEDDHDLRELFTYLLEDEQYCVKAYATATSFKKSLEIVHPDMVILDVMLPDGNGLDICREMKENPSTSAIPVMIMSAQAYISEMKASCPAEEFIQKPLDIFDFVKRVDRHMKN